MSFITLRVFLLPRLISVGALAFLCLLSCSLVVFAQGGVGSSRGLPGGGGGNSIIRGRVYFPETSSAAGKRLKVRLTSTDMMDQTTATDEDGSFVFNGLAAGHYTLMVDGGKEFDSVVEPVSIDREASSGGRNMNLNITLKSKGSKAAADAAFAKVPKPAQELYAKGLESAAKNDHKKAAEQFSGAVALYPEFLQALGELGLQYLKLGQPDKAAEPLKKAVEMSPKDFTLRLNYGIALLGKKNNAEAEQQLREALKLNGAAPTAHMYLGISLLSLIRDEKTKQFLPDKYAEAQKELETAISSGKDEVAQAHRYLGGIYWGNKDYRRAADEFEVYVKLAPKAADAEKIRDIIKDLRSKP
jgi:Tfp pilus assembly protein PilF